MQKQRKCWSTLFYSLITFSYASMFGSVLAQYSYDLTSHQLSVIGHHIVSTFAKIFSLVLRNRLNLWREANTIFNNFQFGYRNQRSTSDCIFILHSLIQKVLKQNSNIYCAFVDYEKTFDTVSCKGCPVVQIN